jgi:HD-GYP domain-containing protein (c-di-GMP phosphodiesterase class II)
MSRTASTGARTRRSGEERPDATSPTSGQKVGPLLSIGFALMALVPILLAVYLLDRRPGGMIGLPGLIVVLMLASALAGFCLIRQELRRTLADVVQIATRQTSGDLSRFREASEDEIGKISTTIQSISTRLQERVDGSSRVRDRVTDGIDRVAHAVQASQDTNQLISLLVEGALTTVGARTAYLVGVDEDAGDFVTEAATGEEAEVALGWRIPLGEGIPGRCARERRAVIVSGAELADYGAPAFGSPLTSTIAIPLVLGETLFGILVVHGRAAGGNFSDEDAAALTGYGAVATAALGSWGPRDQLQEAIDETLAGLAAAVEARDPYARGHVTRVARYCEEMGKALRLDADTRRTLRRAALVHDLGKITLPDALLRKEGRFTPEELEIVRTHPAAGERLLRGIPALAALAPLVRHHHERCDGSGYPDGLPGDAVSLPTHVLIVANAFDILTSDRSYRKATSLTEALETLRAKAGVWYDRRAVHALLGLDKSLLSAARDATDGNATVKGRATASVSVRE